MEGRPSFDELVRQERNRQAAAQAAIKAAQAAQLTRQRREQERQAEIARQQRAEAERYGAVLAADGKQAVKMLREANVAPNAFTRYTTKRFMRREEHTDTPYGWVLNYQQSGYSVDVQVPNPVGDDSFYHIEREYHDTSGYYILSLSGTMYTMGKVITPGLGEIPGPEFSLPLPKDASRDHLSCPDEYTFDRARGLLRDYVIQATGR